MANDDFPRGLIPYNHRNGNGLKLTVYEAQSGTATGPMFIGQPVRLVAAGVVENAPEVGGTGTAYLGIAYGFLGENYGPPSLPFNDTGGTTKRYVIVADEPSQEFLVQEDTGGTALANLDRGATCDLIYRSVGSGNNTTGFANLELDASSVVATNSGAVMLIRYQDITNTDGTQNAAGDYAKWIVRITNHQLRGQPIINTAV